MKWHYLRNLYWEIPISSGDPEDASLAIWDEDSDSDDPLFEMSWAEAILVKDMLEEFLGCYEVQEMLDQRGDLA